jgi:hypothetical protein
MADCRSLIGDWGIEDWRSLDWGLSISDWCSLVDWAADSSSPRLVGCRSRPNPQSTIPNPAIINPQSLNPQSAIRNHHSSIFNELS